MEDLPSADPPPSHSSPRSQPNQSPSLSSIQDFPPLSSQSRIPSNPSPPKSPIASLSPDPIITPTSKTHNPSPSPLASPAPSPRFHSSVLTSAPLWVTLKQVPPQLWSDEGFDFIASGIGFPLPPSRQKPSLLGDIKIRVLVDLQKPLPSAVVVRDIDNNSVRIELSFDRLPPQCSSCSHFGHLQHRCPTLRRIPSLHLPPSTHTGPLSSDAPPQIFLAPAAGSLSAPRRVPPAACISSPHPLSADPARSFAVQGCAPPSVQTPQGNPSSLPSSQIQSRPSKPINPSPIQQASEAREGPSPIVNHSQAHFQPISSSTSPPMTVTFSPPASHLRPSAVHPPSTALPSPPGHHSFPLSPSNPNSFVTLLLNQHQPSPSSSTSANLKEIKSLNHFALLDQAADSDSELPSKPVLPPHFSSPSDEDDVVPSSRQLSRSRPNRGHSSVSVQKPSKPKPSRDSRRTRGICFPPSKRLFLN